MITTYRRPKTFDKAISLLSDKSLNAVALAGGTFIKDFSDKPITVVDLQALGLDVVEVVNQEVEAGSMVTMQKLRESDAANNALRRAIMLEAGKNVCNTMTLAGHLASCDGRSPLTTALLALDVSMTWQPGNIRVQLGDHLPVRSHESPGLFISGLSWKHDICLTFEYVARSPLDRPIVCVALAQWPSGRTRLALGGYGNAPIIAFDGPEPAGIEYAAKNAFYDADDEWASAEYRQEVAVTLARRCLNRIQAPQTSEGEV